MIWIRFWSTVLLICFAILIVKVTLTWTKAEDDWEDAHPIPERISI